MSDNKPGTNLTADELHAVGGGECNMSDYISAIEQFKEAYENLIDLTSYVIERVSGP